MADTAKQRSERERETDRDRQNKLEREGGEHRKSFDRLKLFFHLVFPSFPLLGSMNGPTLISRYLKQWFGAIGSQGPDKCSTY